MYEMEVILSSGSRMGRGGVWVFGFAALLDVFGGLSVFSFGWTADYCTQSLNTTLIIDLQFISDSRQVAGMVNVGQIKYYFTVDTTYVQNKLKLLLFPFTKKVGSFMPLSLSLPPLLMG
jgi:hypothetical protein